MINLWLSVEQNVELLHWLTVLWSEEEEEETAEGVGECWWLLFVVTLLMDGVLFLMALRCGLSQ